MVVLPHPGVCAMPAAPLSAMQFWRTNWLFIWASYLLREPVGIQIMAMQLSIWHPLIYMFQQDHHISGAIHKRTFHCLFFYSTGFDLWKTHQHTRWTCLLTFFLACSKLEAMAIHVVKQACEHDICTLPTGEILSGKNAWALLVCGFLMKSFKKISWK